MRKLITIASLILITIFAVSCSKDDDGAVSAGTGNLIGTWKLDFFISNGNLTEEIICDEQVQYVFLSDASYTKTIFAGTGSTNCLKGNVINGTWSNTSGNNFELKPNIGGSSANLSITFQDNFTKFVSTVSSSRTEVFVKE
jgi:hypothetical protein